MEDIKVIEEWILVKPEKPAGESKTPAGLVVLAETKNRQEVVKRAQVLQISDDIAYLVKKDKEDEDAAIKYGIGDTVLFYGKTGIPIQNGEYMFLKYDGMLAIERKKESVDSENI